MNESEIREKLATCTRILAMQGLISLFGHVSVYWPERRQVFLSPGMGSDRASTGADGLFILDLSGRVMETGDGDVPVEWPIHTALHGARTDALAIAHLHAPYATLFAIARRDFRPVTLQGALFVEGVPLYRKAQLIKTPAQGHELVGVIDNKRAVLMRGHGIVVVGRDLEEILYASLILEDDARKTMQAAQLGEVGFISEEECRAFDAESGLDRRSHRTWDYFARLESRWDRQMSTGKAPLLP